MSFVCEENTKPVSFHGQRCWTRDFCVCTKAYRIDCDSHMALGSGQYLFSYNEFYKKQEGFGTNTYHFYSMHEKTEACSGQAPTDSMQSEPDGGELTASQRSWRSSSSTVALECSAAHVTRLTCAKVSGKVTDDFFRI